MVAGSWQSFLVVVTGMDQQVLFLIEKSLSKHRYQRVKAKRERSDDGHR